MMISAKSVARKSMMARASRNWTRKTKSVPVITTTTRDVPGALVKITTWLSIPAPEIWKKSLMA